MNIKAEELVVNGVTYVPKNSIDNKTQINTEGLECSVIRTRSAGVFYGFIKERNGLEAVVLNCKRIWAWYGAASLSELAVRGVSKPKECKIPVAIPKHILTEVIEIIPLSSKAYDTLESVPLWTA